MPKVKILVLLYFLGLIGFSCLMIYSQLGFRTPDTQTPIPEQSATNTIIPTTVTQSIPIATASTTEIPASPTTAVLPPHIPASDISTGQVRLNIPAIQVNSVIDLASVVDTQMGLTFTQPENNPLWIPDSSTEIGLPGVSIIYGHRQWGPTPKVFTDLDNLIVGDHASIETPQYQFFYSVTEILIINPDDLWPVATSHDLVAKSDNRNSLMLITCTPWGTNWQRLVIFLTLEAVT